MLRAVIGGGRYLAAVAALGFAVGTLIRHAAGALSAFFGILFGPQRRRRPAAKQLVQHRH